MVPQFATDNERHEAAKSGKGKVMYPNLKLAIFKRGIRQNHLAKELGMTDAVLSKIIHGFREPSHEQRVMLANYLSEDQEWLFERFEAAMAVAGVSPVSVRSGASPRKADGDS